VRLKIFTLTLNVSPGDAEMFPGSTYITGMFVGNPTVVVVFWGFEIPTVFDIKILDRIM
jgi:hypothetical protein